MSTSTALEMQAMSPAMAVPAHVSYLRRNGCFVNQGSKAELTHTLMNGHSGGKLSIGDSLLDGFFAAYGQDLAAGHPLYVVERKSHVFNMHFDCDFPSMISDVQIDQFMDVVCKSVARYFGWEDQQRCPAAAEEEHQPKKKRKKTAAVAAAPQQEPLPHEASCLVCANLGPERAGPRVAPGLHIIFPYAPVDQAAALSIWAGVVSDLEACDALRPLVGDKSWQTIMDICVLSSNGLRMVGSYKSVICSTCRATKENREYCLQCSGTGRTSVRRAYWPVLAYPKGAEDIQQCLKRARDNPAHGARVCSTRRPRATPVSARFALPLGAPSAPELKKSSSTSTNDAVRLHDLIKADKVRAFPEQRGGGTATDLGPRLSADSKEMLQLAVRAFSPHHAGLCIRDVRLWKSRDEKVQTVLVHVYGHGHRYCLNKGSDHTSQSIYFAISPFVGLTQRCFSTKDVARLSGCSCKNYSSAGKQVPHELRTALFGEAGLLALRRVAPPPMCFFAGLDDDDKKNQSSTHPDAFISTVKSLPVVLERKRDSVDMGALAGRMPLRMPMCR